MIHPLKPKVGKLLSFKSKREKYFFLIVLFLLIFLLAIFVGVRSSQKIVPLKERPIVRFEISNGEIVYGSSTSPFKIVEYYDLECPYCRNLHEALSKNKNLLNYVGYVYRPFPLPYLHEGAGEKGLILLCANEQNKETFLQGMEYAYHNLEIAPSLFEAYLVDKVSSKEKFTNCITQRKYKEFMEKSINEGRILGVQGTPSLAFYRNDTLIKVVGLVGDTQGMALIKAFIGIPN
jgi:protein-disulfide isomerase